MRVRSALPVLEWSPAGVSLFDPVSRRIRQLPTLAEAAQGLSGSEVVVAISRRASFIRAMRVPDAPKETVRPALQLNLAQNFPIPIIDLCFDFRLTDDVDEQGRLAIVSAMRASELRAVREELRAGGVRPLAVVPAALGAAFLARTLGLTDAAVVSRGPEGLAIDLVCGGELRHSRVIADAALDTSVDVEVARTYAAAGVECGPIVAAGGIVARESTIETERLPLEALSSATPDSLGLSLELEETLLRRARHRVMQKARLAALLWLAALAFGLLVYLDRVEAQAAVNRQRSRANLALKKVRTEKQRVEARLADEEAHALALKRAFDPAQTLGDALTIAANSANEGLWLTGITLDRGKTMSVRGTARTSESVQQYLQRLSSEQRFRDVRLVFANNSQIEEERVVQFSIQGFPVGNLPLVDVGRTARR